MRTLYLLHCSDTTLYTGITTDLERRVNEHNTSPKGATYTKGRRPVTLVRSQQVADRSLATKLELQLKKMTKQQKELLVQQKETIFLSPPASLQR